MNAIVEMFIFAAACDLQERLESGISTERNVEKHIFYVKYRYYGEHGI